jgi:hypothetical protein
MGLKEFRSRLMYELGTMLITQGSVQASSTNIVFRLKARYGGAKGTYFLF